MTEHLPSKPRTRIGQPIMPLVPTTIEECWQMAKYFSLSGVVPSSYPGRPGSDDNVAAVFGAIQMGATVGVPAISALANIMIVNGRYAGYGDFQLAIVRNSGQLESIDETFEGEAPADGSMDYSKEFKAVCITKRVGEEKERRTEFSVSDAVRARLWMKKGKSGGDTPWCYYPERMLKYRARAFNLRDNYGDVLLGLQHSAEELEDAIDFEPGQNGVYGIPARVEKPDRAAYGAAAAATSGPETASDDQPAETAEGESETAEGESAGPAGYMLVDAEGEDIGEFGANAWVAELWDRIEDLAWKDDVRSINAIWANNEHVLGPVEAEHPSGVGDLREFRQETIEKLNNQADTRAYEAKQESDRQWDEAEAKEREAADAKKADRPADDIRTLV